MLVIRFIKTGKKNQPFFRIVVTDKKNPPRGGRFLEILGNFNPLTKKRVLKAERIRYWLSKGAQPSARVHNLLIGERIIKGEKIAVHHVRKSKKEAPSKEEKPATEEVKTEESQPEVAEEKEKTQKSQPSELPAKEDEKPKEPPVETKEEEKKEDTVNEEK